MAAGSKGSKGQQPQRHPLVVERRSSPAEQIQRHQVVGVSWSGPIPDPNTLAAFDRIVPGSADRIIARFEKQSDHRMELERMVITSGEQRARWGQIFAFILGITGLAGSSAAVITGHPLGGALFGGTLVSLVGLFIYGRESGRRERQEKNTKLRQ